MVTAACVAIFVLAYWLSFVRRLPVVLDQSESNRCATCSYDLLGLPASAPCPECGATDRGRWVRPWEWEVVRSSRALAGVSAAVMLAAVVLPYMGIGLFEDPVQALIYHAEGHAWDVSWRAAHLRRMIAGDVDLALAPLTIAASLTPLLARILPRRRQWLAFVSVIVFGLVLMTVMMFCYVVNTSL